MRERLKLEEGQNNSEQLNYTYIFGISGLIGLLIGLYYTRKLFFLENKEHKIDIVEPVIQPIRVNKLDSFD